MTAGTGIATLVGATALIGGGIGAGINAATGGNALNGFCSGAINGAISSFIPIPFINDFLGGVAGSVVADGFENMDNPGLYDGITMLGHALISGGIQLTIGSIQLRSQNKRQCSWF